MKTKGKDLSIILIIKKARWKDINQIKFIFNFKTSIMIQQRRLAIAYAKTKLAQQKRIEKDLKRRNYGRNKIAGT